MNNLRKVFGYLVKLYLLAILFFCCIQPDAALAKTASTQAKPTVVTQAKPLVTQEIRYHLAEAGEVFLVWGVNDWKQIPSKQQPPGTIVKERVMYTPMLRKQDNFVVQVQVPTATKIDYLFQITKARRGDRVEVWDNNSEKNYIAVATLGGVATVKGTAQVAAASANSLKIPAKLQPLRLAVIVILAILSAYGLMQLIKIFQPDADELKLEQPRSHSKITIFTLIAITVIGLLLRLLLAWQTKQFFPENLSRLTVEELEYERLAYKLLQGSFFESPGTTPVYPLFIAGCYLIFGYSLVSVLYAQAIIGAVAVPLTFMLARHFTGPINSLVAAALIAVHSSLLFHSTRLYAESIYIVMLLVALLGLLWALEKPLAYRFNLAGAMLAITNLCRPTMMLFPLVLPLLMPRTWNLSRKIGLFVVYAGTIAMLTAPWTYHNYRTYNTFLPYSVSTALWQGSPEYYHLAQKRTILDIWAKELNPNVNGGHDPFTIEGDRYFNKRAFASILAEPGIYIWYCLQKSVYFWLGNPVSDWPYQAMFNVAAMRPYFSPLRITGIFAARLLPIAALAGLIILRRRWRDFLPLIAVCSYFTVVHALTYAEVRYSEPLYPIVAIIIATAAGEIQRQVEAKVRVEN